MTTMKKFGKGMLILLLLLTGVVFVASASADDSMESALESEVFGISDSEERVIPDFGPKTFENLSKDPNVLATKGQIPQFDTKEERLTWYDKLDKSKDIVKDDMDSYLYPKGPVIGYGWNINGYFKVTFYKGMDVTDSQINEIYNLIERGASKTSIQEIPVVFKKEDFIQEAASGYTDRYRPVIGAIQITVRKNGGNYTATLGFPAKKSDGTKGYVTAKHFASSIDMAIHQPTYLSNNSNLIGDVDILGDHYADASFIEHSDVEPKIHTGSGVTKDISGFLSTTPTDGWVGWPIYISGKTSGVTYGTITDIGTTVTQDGWAYYNQVTASYPTTYGDSGAPVYRISSSNKLYIIGINHGFIGSDSYFSPLSGVVSDLGVYPLRV
ncbi:hypothetical protein FTO70_16290 [Methanosarcina sp. KYL-1]|uniref:S1 family peptidase n=1 Tax=Methanosarcina sp. KYL-1 TaxID=2602068 RepID=UPI0021012F15|nr:S1 family peptidase [Methanosarcina sp. KYL-1]MCQ1537205.1 hypothetical protein [Methanosarcina sp. KYL-1]